MLLSEYAGLLSLTDNMVPASLQDYVLPSIPCQGVSYVCGDWLQQEIKGPRFTLQYCVCRVSSPDKLISPDNLNVPYLQVALANTLQYDVEGLERLTFYEHRYNLVYVRGAVKTYFFTPGRVSAFITIYIPPDEVKERLSLHSAFELFVRQYHQNKPHTLFHEHPMSDLSIMRRLYDILYGLATASMQEQSDMSIYDLVDHIFRKRINGHHQGLAIKEKDIPRVYAARDYLIQRLGQKIDIDEVAKEAGLKTRTLKEYFYRFYGVTIADYLKSVKMDYARYQLVHTDKSVKEIAAALGFGEASFSKTFTSYFGETPTLYRKNIKKMV
ncbi:MAG: hypothetical protein DI539_23400 [Flavobacterium psychrophilum]|nr:MAG: hypothetical protein DI539_23400 [Flavobacterium psychrophilum]